MEYITYDNGCMVNKGFIMPIDCNINGKHYKGEIGIRADIRKSYLLPEDDSDYNVSHRVFMWISYDKKVRANFRFCGKINGKDWKGYEYVNAPTIANFVLKEIKGIHKIESDTSEYAKRRVKEWRDFICEKEIEDMLCNELSKFTNGAE